MDIRDIKTAYEEGYYTFKYPDDIKAKIYSKLPETYVFDENFTVKHNRELVEAHNNEIKLLKQKARESQAELDRRLTDDVVAYIKDNYNLNEAQARMVERWTYNEKHSFMFDYFSSIDTFAAFADDLVNCEEAI